MPSAPVLAAALAALALSLAGCGGLGGEGRSVTVTSGELTVTAEEYRFDPENVTVPVGPLRVRIVNRGSLAHNWRIYRGGRQVAGTETFQGGAERTLVLDLKAGVYRIACSVTNHRDLGMEGRLVVRRSF